MLTDLEIRLKNLPPEKQEEFFYRAAKFFSNSELSCIISEVKNGENLFSAHVKSGVIKKYFVDLEKLL